MGRRFTEKILNAVRIMLLALTLLCGISTPFTVKAQAVNQTITFNPLPDMVYGDPVFSPGATASSGLPVTYISSDATVAKVINGNTIRIIGTGTVFITAEQPGNATYNRAVRVSQQLIVAKANLTIAAVSQTRTYGSSNSTLKFTYTGLKYNETALSPQPTVSTTATALSNVGVYDIIVKGGASNNYNITRVNGTITVNPANLVIRADNKTKLYGAANPSLTVTYSGFKNNETASKLLTRPVISTTAVRNSDPGTYPITATGATSNNYNISYVDGALTVGRAVLTVTVINKTKIYGSNVPTLTYTITGFASGQTAADLTSPVLMTTTATKNSPVGKYAIIASGATAANYDIKYVQGTLQINKAALTIKANDFTRVYGAENPELTLTYTGFVLGETAEMLTQQPVVSTAAVAATPAGSYTIRVSGAATDNYTITYVAGKLTISKATLRIKADNLSRPYGAANPAFTFTYTGFVNGEDENVLARKPSATTTAVLKSITGRYTIIASGATAVNYTIIHSTGTLTVEKVILTVKANDITRFYGSTSPAFSVTYTGFVNGETVSVLTKKPTLTSPGTATSPVGEYTITPSGATAVNYNFIYETGTLIIGKRTLTITAVNKTKMYGQANPAFNFTSTGLANGERTSAVINGTLQLSTTATAASHPGTYPIVISEVTSDNYDVVLVNGTLTITKAVLTITSANTSKTYGQANPRLRYTISGYVNGDDADVFTQLPETPTTTATVESPVGKYSITTSGAVIDGFYDLKYVSGTLTVGKALLRVAGASATRVYGQPNPEFATNITGYVNGDTRETAITQEPTATTPALENSPVGVYAVQPKGGTSTNYSFTYVAGKLTVTPAALLIKANDATRDYGQADPEFTATYTGLTSFDTPASLTQGPAFATTATANSIPGTFPITASGAVSPNYTITYAPGTLTINKPKLVVKANNQSKDYGLANPELTLSYSGFVNGDTETIFTTPPATTTSATTSSNAGSYDIMPSGGLTPAYDLIYTKGTLTVNKVPLTATANDATRFYGVGNPAFGITYSGFVNNDTEANLSTKPTVTTTAIPTSPLGTYTLVPGGGISTNYNFTYVNGTLTVTPGVATITFAPISVKTYGNADFDAGATNNVNEPIVYTSANPLVATIINNKIHITGSGSTQITAAFSASSNYSGTLPVTQTLTVNKAVLTVKSEDKTKIYGAANPAFTITYTGFVNGETQAIITDQATASTTATVASSTGSYDIIPSGGSAANYEFAYSKGTLTINKATLTITAQNASRVFGAANPVVGVTYSGFLNDDTDAAITIAPTVSTTAAATSPVGNYSIIPSGGASANYGFTYVNGILTITPASTIITFAPLAPKTYGAADFDAGATNTVGEQVIYTSGNTAVATIVNNRVHITGAGSANITASFATGSNYGQTTPVTQTLTVNKAALTVKAENKSKVYGTANPALTVTYTGFVNGETQAVLTAQATATTPATVSSIVGDYTITPSGGSAVNYQLAYITGTLTVTKAPLTVTAQNATRAFGVANPAFGVTYTGFVNGDTELAIAVPPTVTTTATATSRISQYPLVPAAGTAANYNFVYVNGTLTITGGAATISFAELPAKTFGDADFDAGATNNVGETIEYASSNTTVASIVSGKIHITGAGTAIITASFAASSGYSQTQPQTQLLVVNKAQQNITFAGIPLLSREDKYSLQNVISSSGLPVTFTVADATIADVQGQTLTAKQIGNTTITAMQAGNNNYLPATAVTRALEVKNIEGKVEIEVHRAMSPNGDGINDVFFIEGITKFPQNKVLVYNRNGVKIFDIDGYDNASRSFNGRSNINGQLQQPGTYVYVIQFTADGKGRHVDGAFVLKY